MIRPMCVCAACLGVAFLVWIYALEVHENKENVAKDVRRLLVSTQDSERRLQRITRGRAHPLTEVFGEGRDDLQLRIAGVLSGLEEFHSENVLNFKQSVHVEAIAFNAELESLKEMFDGIDILRVDFETVVGNGKAFLYLMASIDKKLGGWPSEIRACDIQTTSGQKLAVRCVLDIFYWSVNA